jgi:PDZ domain-containing protein
VSLFADIAPVAEPRRRDRGWIGWGLVFLAFAIVVVIAFLPSTYVIERPGPVFDTLGTTTVGDEKVPLIEVPGETTYDTSGSLDMLTVSIVGSPDAPPNWLEIAGAWIDPSQAVVPIDAVYAQGQSLEESNEQGAVEMENSQKEAIAAALHHLGYEFDSELTVEQILEESPADGVLEPGDLIVSVDGEAFADVSALRGIIAEHGTGSPAEVTVLRDAKQLTLEVTPVLSDETTDAAPIIGVILSSEYDFPFDVEIQLDNVGGPSAGQMFALGIIDKLTPGELTGGESIAGTGTITASGEIGPIGGIRQKMYGAERAGADYFLAPADNCGEVDGHVPSGLQVFAVTTLDDSLAVLEAVSDDGDTSDLPTCAPE